MDAEISIAQTRQPPAVRWAQRWVRPALAVYWVGLAVASHWPRLELGSGHEGIFQPDKIFHALAFAGLTWLLTLARPLGRTAPDRLTALAACLIALAYAVLDEASQPWVQRHASEADLLADLIGVLGMYLTLTAGTLPRRWSAWPVHTARAVWLLTTPTLALLALTPAGTDMMLAAYRALGLSLGHADKTTHLVLGIVLTWLLVAAAPAGRRRPRLSAALTVVVMAVSAPILELVQHQTGRGFEVADLYAHQKGLFIGMAVWALLPATLAVSELFRRRPRSVAVPRVGVELPPTLTPLETSSPELEGAASPQRFVGHALLVAGFTLVSRFTGLARDAALAAALGLSTVADAFFIGFLVPNLFRRLFGEGALTASFIPHYTDLLKNDPALARRFASLCFVLLAVVLAGITLLGEAALFLASQAGWGADTALALRLTMIMLPYMPLVCLVALAGGVLQVHGRFGPAAAAPVLLNLVMIAFIGIAVLTNQAGDGLRRTAVIVSVSVLVAGVFQLAWQMLALRRTTPLTLQFTGTAGALRAMLRMMLPMLMGLAVFQINTFFDSLIAFGLSPRNGATHFHLLGFDLPYPIETGAVAALAWAQRLYQFPLGVFGIAVATAIFPALAHAAARTDDDRESAFRTILQHGLRLTVFIGLPASVGLILLRLPLTRVIYERGEFSPEAAARVATILAGYAASVWAYAMTHTLTRAFYALKDSATPLRVSTAMVAFNLTLNVMLIWPFGAAGLAWSTAVSGALQVAVLLYMIRRRIPHPIDATVLHGWGRTAALTLVMAAVLLAILTFWPPAQLTGLGSAVLLAAAVPVGAVIVLGGAWLTGAEELRWLLRR